MNSYNSQAVTWERAVRSTLLAALFGPTLPPKTRLLSVSSFFYRTTGIQAGKDIIVNDEIACEPVDVRPRKLVECRSDEEIF